MARRVAEPIDSERLDIPQFEPKIPDELMEKWPTLDPTIRVLLKQQSIQNQQNEWMMRRLQEGDGVIDQLRDDVESLKKLREILTAKWSVVAFLFLTLGVPILLLWIGRLIERHSN